LPDLVIADIGTVARCKFDARSFDPGAKVAAVNPSRLANPRPPFVENGPGILSEGSVTVVRLGR
jgi:hypothetical protein